jgi:DNA-directed RNA polymerase subunit L
MEPLINNINEENGVLKFTLSNVNVSIANALRRIVLSEIPNFVFRTTPYNENKCNISINTTRFNNEIIKQRLSCIPIHINDMDFPYNDYILEIDEKNDTDIIKIVTTENFKLKNVSNGKYLTKESVSKIFPPDSISQDYIDFVRLRPKISDEIDGEYIKLDCKIEIGIPKEGMFNVVSCCSYGNTPDPVLINEEWSKKEIELKNNSTIDSEIEFIKNDWMALQANRYFIKNSFDFMIETIGVFDNMTILKKACEIMINKFKNCNNVIGPNLEKYIKQVHNTIPNCWDIILENEDYTLGKALEYLLYTNYYENTKELNFCGFKKPHPHINISIIRIGFNQNDGLSYDSDTDTDSRKEGTEETKGGERSDSFEINRNSGSKNIDRTNVIRLINNCCKNGIDIYSKIMESL